MTSSLSTVQVGSVSYDRQPIADHAQNLASTIKGNLQKSLEAIGVDILIGAGKLKDEHTVEYSLPGNIILKQILLYRVQRQGMSSSQQDSFGTTFLLKSRISGSLFL